MVKRERLSMDWKELREARRVGIPENIIGKMIPGYELSEREKELIKSKGKVYVLGHIKDGRWIKQQLRDLPEGSRSSIRQAPKIRREVIDEEEVLERIRSGAISIGVDEPEGYTIADLMGDIDANKDNWFPISIYGEFAEMRYSTYNDGYEIKR